MKTYGKEPEALASITAAMMADLADFPPDKILKAFRTHASLSAEFPTTADLVGLIRRNGRPPLRESDIIAIRRKDGEDRTAAEWRMLHDWQQQQSDGWEDKPETAKVSAGIDEISRLRKRVYELEDENARLADLLHRERMSKGLERPTLSVQQKIEATVEAMRKHNAPEEDIEAFLKSQGVAA